MPAATPGQGTSPLVYRPELDLVRAVGVILVVMGHWTQPAFPVSNMGNITFFVLSGYLISGIIWDKKAYVGAPGHWSRRVGVFYLRRLVRMLPPYYLSLLVGALLPLLTLYQYPYWFILQVSNLLFYKLEHWGEGVGHYWTMAVDEQFYLLWPVVLALLPRRLVWLALLAAGSLLFRLVWSQWAAPDSTLLLLPACLDMFAIGAMLRLAGQQPWLRRLAHLRWVTLSWLGWAVLWAILHVTQASNAWLLVYTSVGSIPAALTINWALQQADRPAFGKHKLLVLRWIGRRSYGCYLYHLFLPVLYQRVIFRVFPSPEVRQLWLAPLPTILVLTPLLIGLAAVSWTLVEGPLNRWKNRFAYN